MADWAVQNQTVNVAEFQLIRADGPMAAGGGWRVGAVLHTHAARGDYTMMLPLGQEISGLCLERVRSTAPPRTGGTWATRGG